MSDYFLCRISDIIHLVTIFSVEVAAKMSIFESDWVKSSIGYCIQHSNHDTKKT